jgi:Tfp pilus assembly protein PilX
MRQKKGIALITLVFIIVIVGILLYSTTIYLYGRINLAAIEVEEHQSLMSAQAGLMYAAYAILMNQSTASVEIQFLGNQRAKYVIDSKATQTNTQYLDARNSVAVDGSTKFLYNWSLINTSITEPVTITTIEVSWTPASSKITTIQINGVTCWTGSQNSGSSITLTTPAPLAMFTICGNNRFYFNSNVTNRAVTAIFRLSNGKFFGGQVWPVNEPNYPTTEPVYPTGIVSRWKFDEGSGTSAIDSISGNNGTLVNAPQWATGKFGTSLYFNGSNSLVHIPDAVSLRASTEGTLLAWIKPATTLTQAGLLHKGDQITAADEAYYMQLVNGNLRGGVRDSAGTLWQATSTAAINLNRWHFVAMTWRFNGIYIYLNAAAIGFVSGSHLPRVTPTGDMNIGALVSQPPYYSFNGYIDEVALFNRALTLNEIKAIYIGGGLTTKSNTGTIISTGKIKSGSNTLMRQTMIATYEGVGSKLKIKYLNETSKHIME